MDRHGGRPGLRLATPSCGRSPRSTPATTRRRSSCATSSPPGSRSWTSTASTWPDPRPGLPHVGGPGQPRGLTSRQHRTCFPASAVLPRLASCGEGRDGEGTMPRSRDILQRFRPAGTPGAASAAGRPRRPGGRGLRRARAGARRCSPTRRRRRPGAPRRGEREAERRRQAAGDARAPLSSRPRTGRRTPSAPAAALPGPHAGAARRAPRPLARRRAGRRGRTTRGRRADAGVRRPGGGAGSAPLMRDRESPPVSTSWVAGVRPGQGARRAPARERRCPGAGRPPTCSPTRGDAGSHPVRPRRAHRA